VVKRDIISRPRQSAALPCVLASLLTCVGFGYEVSVESGNVAAGETIVVPINVDTVKGAANVGVRVAYDPQVLVLAGTEEGTLAKTLSDDFVVVKDEYAGNVSIAAFGAGNVTNNVGGTLARLSFTVRDGTKGQYSDITIADVKVGEATGVRDLTVGNAVRTSGGIVWVTEAAALAVAATTDEGENMDAASQRRVRANLRLAYQALQGKADAASRSLREAYENAKRVRVSGPKDLVSTIADMGISPAFAPAPDETGTLQLTYGTPTLEITGFNPSTGEVWFKVTPGAGNEIVSKMATGCLHVYGTDRLGEPMRFVSSVDVDLTPYLNVDTKGEGVATVDMGSHTFLKVKVESCVKTNGEIE